MKLRQMIVSLMALLVLLGATHAYAADEGRKVIFDIPRHELVERYGRMPGWELTKEMIMDLMSSTFEGDSARLLVILVEWDMRPGTYTRETIDSMLFLRDEYPGGSLADYYNEVSYGQLTLTGDVYDWYNAGHYSTNFEFETLLPVIDAWVDYSQYDGNHDGYVDAICFIRSGTGKEDTGDNKDIWSYAVILPKEWARGPWDGVYVPCWNTCPELKPLRDPDNPFEFSGEDTLTGTAVYAHELAHDLGIPDLYDYDAKLDTNTYFTPNDDNDHPLVDWCQMGYGGYGILSMGSGHKPTHFCGWTKKQFGFIEPVVLTGEHEDLVINSIETTNQNSLFLLPINMNDGEYFLLEYRNPHSSAKFDKVDSDFSAYFWPDLTFGQDTLDRGLLITHVHDSINIEYPGYELLFWYSNDGTPYFPHYSVTVEDAGYNPVRDAWSNPEGFVTDSAQWWYPYETRRAAVFSDDVDGQNEFGPNTVPNSDGYYGSTGIYVRVDSIVGEQLYAYVNVPPTSCCLLRGDINHDGVFNPLDAVYFVDWLWRGGPEPPCLEEADVNGDGEVNPQDCLDLVNHFWRSGAAPVPCP